MGTRGARAMAVKELRQLRRDRRTVALLVLQPMLLLVVFGYAASFDVTSAPTVVAGPAAEVVADGLPPVLDVVTVDAELDRDDAIDLLRGADHAAAVVTAAGAPPEVLIDGSRLFAARGVVAALDRAGGSPDVEVLFNPDLETPPVLVPALVGIVLAFAGTIATSIGVVREREAGTLEQLAVLPFSASDVLFGKLAPYLLIGIVDVVLVVTIAVTLFAVPFAGSVALFSLGAALFLLLTLGIGLLVSTVSENQGQAMQLAMLTLLPQILLSGAIFPLDAMPIVLRGVAALLPLTWFLEVALGVMLRDASLAQLAQPLGILAVLSSVAFGLAIVRVRAYLLPAGRSSRREVTA